MAEAKPKEKTVFWMTGEFAPTDLEVTRAVVREGLSKITETTIEFQSHKREVDLEKLVGKQVTLHIMASESDERKFVGTIISVEDYGYREGYRYFVAEMRPWLWFLTLTQECKIHSKDTVGERKQEFDTKTIIEEVFKIHGFTDYEIKASDKYEKREFCVQYRESDFDFISRLMEEEGMHYYFDNKDGKDKLVICDGATSHPTTPLHSTVDFFERDSKAIGREDHIAEWSFVQRVTRGKVTLNDYDFLSPGLVKKPHLLAKSSIPKGKHSHKDYEAYDYPGNYRKETKSPGEKFAKVRNQIDAGTFERYRGAGDVRTLATGHKFTLKEHPTQAMNQEYLVTDAVHFMQLPADYSDKKNFRHDIEPFDLDWPEDAKGDSYTNTFGAMPADVTFRAPRVTAWPNIPGIHSATVVGASGEEITTDIYGRIKVHFHWDRVNAPDDNASCWVRVAAPWAGKDWGMVHIPRVGNEVIIEFEDGDPDRPICTGMLYTKDTMQPWELPKNKTQSGIKTNSSKGGGGYNELMFEDLKGEELMRVQAQKDHQFLVKDRSAVTIGLDAPSPDAKGAQAKSYEMTVEQHVTETVNKGDRTETVKMGNKVETIDKGNMTETVKLGDRKVDVTAGSIDERAGQKIKIEAGVEILLKVGPSTVKIDNSGIQIKGPMIKIQGDAMAEMKSPLTTVKGDATLILKGGITLIN